MTPAYPRSPERVGCSSSLQDERFSSGYRADGLVQADEVRLSGSTRELPQVLHDALGLDSDAIGRATINSSFASASKLVDQPLQGTATGPASSPEENDFLREMVRIADADD